MRFAEPAARRRFLTQSAALLLLGAAAPPTRAAASPGAQLPRWARSLAVGAWATIPGTAIRRSDISSQIAAGLSGPDGSDIGFGNPWKGIMDFSGGTLKRSGSEMLIFGGGGAGAWAGNDVRGLRLEDDQPVWRTRVKPTPARYVHSRHTARQTAHPYMANGDPNARHSYFQPQFDDDVDRFYALGCQNVWEVDQGTFNTVDSAAIDGGWFAKDTHPAIPLKRGFDGSWTCKHALTGAFYAAANTGIAVFEPARNAWSTVFNGQIGGVDRAAAAIDLERGLLLRVGAWGARTRVPVAVDLANREVTIGVLSGPYADALAGYASAGLVWDAGVGAFVCFQDDGHLYRLTSGERGVWVVSRMVLGGTPPLARASGIHSGGPCAIWGRMQYVPNLRGICILQRFDTPAYFVRTS